MQNESDNKKKTIADLVRNLGKGEILDIFRDTCAKYYFSNTLFPVNTNALIAILLDIDYKELVDNVKTLPLEDKGLILGQKEIIKDTFFEINLKGRKFYLIVEFNRIYEDMEKLKYNNTEILNNAVNKAKLNQLLKTFYYQCRTYGTGNVEKNDYLNVSDVIAINLSTFSIDNRFVDDLSEFVMLNPQNNIKLTDKIKYYNLDIANKSKEWYTNKYQESNKREKNLIAFSKLITTTSMRVAKKCINSLDIGMSDKEKDEMKGALDIMFDKEKSKFLSIEEYCERQNKKHDDEFEFFKKELLKIEKEDSLNEGRAKGHAEGRKVGRAEGRKVGRAEGRQEEKKYMIVNSYKENIPIETIAKISNVSLEKVRSIINTYCNN